MSEARDDVQGAPHRGATAPWGLVLALGVVAYAAWLGGQHIPHIGDEAPYLAIVRKTAATGAWLPLATVEGLGQTKPPLLFWMGLVASDGGRAWDLARLRLVALVFTFLTTAAVLWAGTRVGSSRRTGLLGALSFLAFWSTFQYGRPFLTNLPETFFVFLPFAVALARPTRLDGWPFWVLAGFSTGLACLVKSFALVAPVAVAFGAWLLVRRGGDLRAFLRRDLPRGALATILALGTFALWPLLDPHPGAIWHEFVLGENVAKVGDGGWFEGLFSRTHGIWTTLLGPFFNAGFLAPPLLWLAWDAWRRRRELEEREKALWLLLLAFVVVFSLPGHRQSNYLLPAMPAVAVLLGLAWRRIPKLFLGAAAFAVGVGALVAVLFQAAVASDVLGSEAYAPWQRLVPLLALGVAAWAAIRPGRAGRLLHAAVFLAFLALGSAVAPFEGPLGRFEPDVVRSLAGRSVWVPSRFRAREERHRFLLPGVEVEAYPEKAPAVPGRLLARGETVALRVQPDEAPPAGVEVLGGRWDLRTRQTADELRALFLERRFDVLVEREILVRPRGGAR